jgi:hypothetical protein
MRARLATKKLKQLLSPAVHVALEIGVAAAQTPEPPVPPVPPVLEPPVPPVPPVLEPPVPPVLEPPVPLPAVPPACWPPVLDASAASESLGLQPVASCSVTATQPLTKNAALVLVARVLVATHTLPFVDLMEFYKSF